MNFQKMKEADNKYIANTYKRNDLLIVSGKSSRCKDIDGKEYIDFGAGIGVNSLGFCDDNWVDSVCEQVKKLNHTSNLYYTEPQILLAEKLCTRTEMNRVFFSNSGAEANEAMVKTARKYGIDNFGESHYKIIALESSFHGRTFGALAATAQPIFQKPFGKSLDGFTYAKPNDINSVKEKVDQDTCAIIMELVQGEGGVNNLDIDFVQAVEKLCKEKNLLLLIDEVQTGIGRTGTFMTYEQYNINPNMVSLAKGLGGGLPIGATLFDEKVENTLTFGNHATTFGGNPIVSAGALKVLESIDNTFLTNVAEKGKYLKEKIISFPKVKSVSGLGMMIGIEIDNVSAPDVVKRCSEQGLIVLTAKEKIRLLPPLNISYEDIDEGLDILEKTLKELSI